MRHARHWAGPLLHDWKRGMKGLMPGIHLPWPRVESHHGGVRGRKVGLDLRKLVYDWLFQWTQE